MYNVIKWNTASAVLLGDSLILEEMQYKELFMAFGSKRPLLDPAFIVVAFSTGSELPDASSVIVSSSAQAVGV
ncbi:unnamed protein product [Acanthoscelides obtectus]|uniref:Uncharacterized protein n=1 Tax=Acanthoscelides obtectus TaxID=200917 RepID=A0A9P0KKZ6_ACAOB|nr:unnamed protein product [Acanthoscelides obtectus]CAK1642620.1 hypothetical protein AOBTE_LOCUS13140 [Acanthoscelides obtectus]